MSFIEFTNADAAKASFVNALAAVGVEPTASVDANALVFAALANQVAGPPLVQGGAGFAGTGTVNKQVVTQQGDLIVTQIFIDLTGLSSSTTDLDIIGTGANPAYFVRVPSSAGTILGGNARCFELPAGGVTDIDIYKATVGTGVFDGAVTSLTGQAAVLTAAGAWALGTDRPIIADSIATGDYLYLTSGAAGTAGAYTAGRLLITLYGV